MVEALGEGPELGLHGPGQQPVAVQVHILCSVLGGHRDLHNHTKSSGCVLHASVHDDKPQAVFLLHVVRHQALMRPQAVCLALTWQRWLGQQARAALAWEPPRLSSCVFSCPK